MRFDVTNCFEPVMRITQTLSSTKELQVWPSVLLLYSQLVVNPISSTSPSAICTYGSASDRNQEHAKFSDTVMQCFRPLVYLNISGPSGASYHPPAALRHVVDYLTESISAMNSKQPTLNIPGNSPKTYTLKDLKEDFDTIIRKGNMFGQRFYTLIYEHHQEIRKKTTPTE